MPIPLHGHVRFATNNDEDLSRAVSEALGARLIQATRGLSVSRGNQFRLPRSELWACAYSHRTKLSFGGGDYLRVQIPLSGLAVTSTAGRELPVAAARGCITSSEATIAFGENFKQIAWRISREELVRKLASITGLPCTKPLEFSPSLDLGRPTTSCILTILNSILTCIDTLPAESRALVVSELEEALMVALLGSADHNLRPLLNRRVDQAATWQVRRTEEFIEANCDRPLRVEDLAEVTGSSARSLYRAFRQQRGYTPMEFLMQRRLERARRVLADPQNKLTITAIALAAGFASVSHFSRTFSAAYGESPSVFVRRRD